MKNTLTGKTTPPDTGDDRSDLARVLAMKDGDIEYDEDNPRTTPEFWEGAVMKVGDTVIGHTPRRRGPGKKPARIPIQLRLPPDVLAAWRATGTGWQTRMVDDLTRNAPR